LTQMEAMKTRRATDHGRAAAATDALGAKAQRGSRSLRAFANIAKNRRRKLLGIRRQLMAETYNIEERLDAVLDKVLQELALD
jgi:hypothetical protein